MSARFALEWREAGGLMWLQWDGAGVCAAFPTREGGVSPAPLIVENQPTFFRAWFAAASICNGTTSTLVTRRSPPGSVMRTSPQAWLCSALVVVGKVSSSGFSAWTA